ncbi:calcium/sodium antiporter [Planctobacterium marinum]|uniref:calcium/sodium antiporter n=1 Tax=Planctobacterium marinum TaxID=1631968 RepID=UPI001E62FC8E|nr:calcium/sodium antiporter [Planctobacterium marinum]MCC2604866.1 calcium/sodium antiporter [Planctobacterium marinum]
MLTDIALFIVGLALLSWSADRFVYGASAMAKNFGISPMVIGMTIVAMGSSAPEIMVSATASMAGNADTAVGNAIGSNITNIGLVLGLTALFKPLMVSSGTIRREMPILLIVSLTAAWFLADLSLSRSEGIALMILFFVTIGGLTWLSIQADRKDPYGTDTAEEIPSDVPTHKAIFWVMVGMVLLPISADIMVDSAVNIARYFGMSELMIGLTIIAIGTSLPELAASIAGVLKGEDDMALGNIIGSNIFNILAVMAMPGLIAPGLIDADAANRDIHVMLVFTVLLLLFSFGLRGVRKITRWEGGILVAGYIGYLTFLFVA